MKWLNLLLEPAIVIAGGIALSAQLNRVHRRMMAWFDHIEDPSIPAPRPRYRR